MTNKNCVADTIELKKIMVERGYKTIGSLASASQINRTTLGKVLDGKIQPSSDVMFKLVQTLDISPDNAGRIFFTIDLRSA